jgi:hypothetical protein
MATKKKTKKKSTGPKRIAGGKATLAKKKVQKKPAKKKAASKQAASKKKGGSQKTLSGKTATNQPTRRRIRGRAGSAFSGETPGPDSGGQSGDLQGLSNAETADSESVDELLEEGNAFEAGVVSGVEDADDGDEKEIRTREVPEDDVPGEYLDEE